MIKIKKLLATVAIGLFTVSAIGCSMIAKTPEAIQNTVLAKVEDQTITKGDVDEIASYYLNQYGEDYDTNEELAETVKSIRLQSIDMLVEEKVLELKATELNLLPTDEEVKAEVDTYLENQKVSLGGEEKFTAALTEANLTLEGYTETLTKSIRMQLISNKVIEDMFKDIKTEDSAIETYYNENTDMFITADVSHILVADEALAKELKAKIDAGEDFAELAKTNSTDAASAVEGGSLGNVSFGNSGFVQEFVDGMISLKEKGGITDPVKSQHGYHIIKVENVKTSTLDESKDTIKTTLENEEKNTIYNDNIDKWEKEYKVKKYENRL